MDGRTPGGGRVRLFEKKRKCWIHVEEIELPAYLPFIDYSGMSLDHGRVAIVSQENSMLWVGTFNETTWSWQDEGQLYEVPSPRGRRNPLWQYRRRCLDRSRTRIATVSDRRKKQNQPDERLSDKDQSIHIFDVPI